jgi:putative tryptophan/tyrosine transport system substrate-binding protein
MKRLAVAFLALATLAAPLAAEAQPATKVYRIGYLASATATGRPIEALRASLRELGWVEGQNIVIDYRQRAGSTGSPTSPSSYSGPRWTSS